MGRKRDLFRVLIKILLRLIIRLLDVSSKAVLGFVVFLYGFVPVVLLLFPMIHNSFVFMNFAKWPWTDFKDLQAAGVSFTGRNFYLEPEPGVKIGLWHVLPRALHEQFDAEKIAQSEIDFEKLLSSHDDTYPIMLYAHGNGFTRAAPHRVELLNLLAAANYHVIALDYRGYADSDGSAREAAAVADVETAFAWLRAKAPRARIFVWGHSLGTAISTKAVGQICRSSGGDRAKRDKATLPAGLILEAPFNNISEAVRNVPITRLFRCLPMFDRLLIDPLRTYWNLDMNTDLNIQHVEIPILILHAKDDEIIPFELGERLFAAAQSFGRDVQFVSFEKEGRYRHKFLCRAPELPGIVAKFADYCTEKLAAAALAPVA